MKDLSLSSGPWELASMRSQVGSSPNASLNMGCHKPGWRFSRRKRWTRCVDPITPQSLVWSNNTFSRRHPRHHLEQGHLAWGVGNYVFIFHVKPLLESCVHESIYELIWSRLPYLWRHIGCRSRVSFVLRLWSRYLSRDRCESWCGTPHTCMGTSSNDRNKFLSGFLA